ncbi:MAG: hypothetical protein VKP70_03805 [Cyanobacteriota bacterium]|nr:hypothetical protein [Cyanobacteriota bacterium]
MSGAIAARLRRSVGRLRHRWSLPYASFGRPPRGGSVSDLFLWRGDGGGTRFIADNTLALLTGAAVEVRHRLTFFDPEGTPFRELDWFSADPYAILEPGDLNLPLGTFIHATFYDPATLSAEGQALWALGRAHRGYCDYRRQADSVWSSVHGNVGGITSGALPSDHRHRLLARRRRRFLYTPQVHLRASQTATLFFLNPCGRPQSIALSLTGTDPDGPRGEPLHTLLVPSLGVRRCVVEGREGYLSCRSRLPMCRPLVFIEEVGNSHHFDVFHT